MNHITELKILREFTSQALRDIDDDTFEHKTKCKIGGITCQKSSSMTGKTYRAWKESWLRLSLTMPPAMKIGINADAALCAPGKALTRPPVRLANTLTR